MIGDDGYHVRFNPPTVQQVCQISRITCMLEHGRIIKSTALHLSAWVSPAHKLALQTVMTWPICTFC